MPPHRLAIALCLVLSSATTVQAQRFAQDDFVRNLYVRYSGAEPTRQIIDVWVGELNKGTSPSEVHAQVLGSNQTFDFVGKNNDSWVRLMYREVLQREPDAEGLRNWLKRLADMRYDRVKLAREFLRSAGNELNSNSWKRPDELTSASPQVRLKSSAQLLFQAVESEFPGYQNYIVRNQAEAFSRAVTSSQLALADRDRSPARYDEAVRSITLSLQSLETAVAQTRASGPSTRLYLDQCRRQLDSMTVGVRPTDSRPPFLGGTGRFTEGEIREYRRLLEAVSRDMASAQSTFRVVIPSGWATTQLLNRVGDTLSDVDRLRDDMRGGISRSEFNRRVQAISTSAGTVTTALNSSRVDVRAMQAWYSVSRSLSDVVDPQSSDFTPAYTSGTWPDLPQGLPGVPYDTLPKYPVPGSGFGGRVPNESLRTIDEAVSECDALILAYTPYSTYNRGVGRLVSDLQDLKNRYSTLRRIAQGAFPTRRDLDAQLDLIASRMRTVSQNWRDLSGDRDLSRLPDLADLNEVDRRVSREMSALR